MSCFVFCVIWTEHTFFTLCRYTHAYAKKNLLHYILLSSKVFMVSDCVEYTLIGYASAYCIFNQLMYGVYRFKVCRHTPAYIVECAYYCMPFLLNSKFCNTNP